MKKHQTKLPVAEAVGLATYDPNASTKAARALTEPFPTFRKTTGTEEAYKA
jgi:hypothetical protein